jgi:hypothetical protein
VKRVLLTGMSGTGKSSVIRDPAARGYKAIDTDDGWCEPLPDGRQRWRDGAIGELLATEDAGVLFVAGCEENQVRFHRRFDLITLLSAPVEVLIERLASRATKAFEQVMIIAAGGQPIGQPFSALPSTPPDPSRHGNRRQAPYPAWSESTLICMACKRPGVRIPLAPRFPRSSAYCDLQR